MEATQQCTTFLVLLSRPWLLVGTLCVGRKTEEAMILLVGDQLLGPKGALLVDLLLVKSLPPRYFTLLVGSRRCAATRHTWSDRRNTNSSPNDLDA